MKKFTVGAILLFTCFLTFPCLADEVSTEKNTIDPPKAEVIIMESQSCINSGYNNKDLTMASEIGVTCTNEFILKSLMSKDVGLYSTENIRECVKEYFKRTGWEYNL